MNYLNAFRLSKNLHAKLLLLDKKLAAKLVAALKRYAEKQTLAKFTDAINCCNRLHVLDKNLKLLTAQEITELNQLRLVIHRYFYGLSYSCL